jgi:hypothetical protein
MPLFRECSLPWPFPRFRIRVNQQTNMSDTKPEPLFRAPLRKLCPICGEISYSLCGVHPQCAMEEADAPRMERIRTLRKAAAPVRKPR